MATYNSNVTINDITNDTINDSGIMEEACNFAVEILEAPHVASLPASDVSKQELIETCELACGGSCPVGSAAEQDRVFLISPEQ